MLETTEAITGDVIEVFTDSFCDNLFYTSDAATSASLSVRLPSLGWEEKTFSFYYRKNDGSCISTGLSYDFKTGTI